MKIVALLVGIWAQSTQPQPTPTPAELTGYGPWRLGMSQDQVRSVSEFGPYDPVSATGGLETRNGQFAGQKTTISFVFGDHGLRVIQIWAYEGRDLDQAVDAFYRVYHYVDTAIGPVEVPGINLADHATHDAFTAALRPRLAAVSNQSYKVQLAPASALSSINVFSSLIHQPQLDFYYVFLYYRSP